ncbi:MAG TPA: hypothetical protein VHB20_19400 [Verrucomicrobiae bacterium]|jgi:hypothetical protein|nr:hypothetical protein [Verrucomicrobiae bacterium]
MNCFKHPVAAVGVCAYCGRGLCSACAPDAARLVCSPACEAALTRDGQAMQMILQKSVQSLRASAFYCYLCGGLSAGAAVAAYFMLPSPFLIYFTGACAVALISSGVWYGRVAKRQG